jgi:hypothetical protein
MVITTSTDLFVEVGFILSEERWTTLRIALARKLTNSTSLHERCPWHAFCKRSDQVFLIYAPTHQETSAVQTLDSHTLKRRTQKTFHWKHREASFHLFSAELFLDHQLR